MALARLVNRGDEVAVVAPPRKLGRMPLLMAAIAVGLLAYAFLAADDSTYNRVFVGIVGVFPGLLAIRCIQLARRNEPLLVVTPDGLRLQRAGLIRWDEVEDVE